MLGGIFYGTLSERIGRKSDHDRRLSCASGTPAMGIFQRIIHDWPGAFLMQFMVQGARVSCRLAKRAGSGECARCTAGFVYQLGNLLASVNATLQARIAETHGGNYGLAMAIVAGAVAILICVFVAFGRETRESSSPVQIATPSRSRPSVIARKHYARRILSPGARLPPVVFTPFQRTTKVNDGICRS